MRAATVFVLALALLLGGASGAFAKKPKSRASLCQKLAKSHKDLAPGSKLVTVVLGDDETGSIRACVLPRGRVRTLTSWDDGLSRDSASVIDTAGTWVLVEDRHADQYGGVSSSLTRFEVRHRRTLSLSGYGCQVSYVQPGCPDGTSHGPAAIAPSGAGAYQLTDLASGVTTLQAFDTAGALTKLADGAIDALRVTTTQISWTQGGMSHTAALPD